VVVVHPQPAEAELGTRLGVVASKRVGNAVARNRGKRLVREWFRRCETLPEADVVVILRSGAPQLTAEVAWSELTHGVHEADRRARRPKAVARPQAPRRDGGEPTPNR